MHENYEQSPQAVKELLIKAGYSSKLLLIDEYTYEIIGYTIREYYISRDSGTVKKE